MNAFNVDKILAIPAGDLAEQSSDTLFKLKNAAADRLTDAKAAAAFELERGEVVLEQLELAG
jgi:hypothetical protein